MKTSNFTDEQIAMALARAALVLAGLAAVGLAPARLALAGLVPAAPSSVKHETELSIVGARRLDPTGPRKVSVLS